MLDVLIALQKARGLRDRPFAASIGLSREHWNKTRHGREPLTAASVQKALRAYPEIRKDATIFLLTDDRKLSAVMEKQPSNIDASASEATRTLVLTTDRQTLACRGATSAPALPDRGTAALSDGDNQPSARKSYVVARPSASDLTSRAVSRVDLDGEWKGVS